MATADAERQKRHAHAERRNDQILILTNPEREVEAGLLILISHRESPDTAERDLGAGRAQASWSGTSGRMPRERRQGMDARSARAHGTSPE